MEVLPLLSVLTVLFATALAPGDAGAQASDDSADSIQHQADPPREPARPADEAPPAPLENGPAIQSGYVPLVRATSDSAERAADFNRLDDSLGRFARVNACAERTKPTYLRIFLPATPQNHRSPPE